MKKPQMFESTRFISEVFSSLQWQDGERSTETLTDGSVTTKTSCHAMLNDFLVLFTVGSNPRHGDSLAAALYLKTAAPPRVLRTNDGDLDMITSRWTPFVIIPKIDGNLAKAVTQVSDYIEKFKEAGSYIEDAVAGGDKPRKGGNASRSKVD